MLDAKVLVALDYEDKEQALAFVEQISPQQCRLKVGKEMFTLFGPEFVKTLTNRGFDVFLDMKYHDIPNTVAKAVRAAAELGVWMVNVHTSGGHDMMVKAKEALLPYGDKRPLLIGVTVLTSMSTEALQHTGVQRNADEQVLHLAGMAKDAGLDGVVCSAQEAKQLKAELGDAFLLVTPGIRPEGSSLDDQTRVMTPQRAITAGSDYLVIGRPITKSSDPAGVLSAINDSLSE